MKDLALTASLLLIVSVPVSIQNDSGFSIGGPIKKDKLFFFGTLQASPFRSTTTASAVVPTPEGFAALRSLFPQGRSANLDRYLSIVVDLRGTTNVIQIPLGGGRQAIPFGTATLTGVSQSFNDYQFLTRVDWAPGEKDSLSFRYLADDQTFSNQFQDTITCTIRDHTIRAGADLLRQVAKESVPFNGRGTLTFSPGAEFPTFGNFVDGFSGTEGIFAQRVFGDPVVFPDAFQQAYFVNDSWRASPNLTLNVMIRLRLSLSIWK